LLAGLWSFGLPPVFATKHAFRRDGVSFARHACESEAGRCAAPPGALGGACRQRWQRWQRGLVAARQRVRCSPAAALTAVTAAPRRTRRAAKTMGEAAGEAAMAVAARVVTRTMAAAATVLSISKLAAQSSKRSRRTLRVR